MSRASTRPGAPPPLSCAPAPASRGSELRTWDLPPVGLLCQANSSSEANFLPAGGYVELFQGAGREGCVSGRARCCASQLLQRELSAQVRRPCAERCMRCRRTGTGSAGKPPCSRPSCPRCSWSSPGCAYAATAFPLAAPTLAGWPSACSTWRCAQPQGPGPSVEDRVCAVAVLASLRGLHVGWPVTSLQHCAMGACARQTPANRVLWDACDSIPQQQAWRMHPSHGRPSHIASP